jgi:hypothetical protein
MVWVAGELPAEEKAPHLQGKDPSAFAWHRHEAQKGEQARRWLAVAFEKQESRGPCPRGLERAGFPALFFVGRCWNS